MLLHAYENGNYNVQLYSDGTKIRTTPDGEMPNAVFPENIDVKITDFCDMGCPMCHEMSTIQGKHGDLSKIPVTQFHPGTEVAIGGGNPLDHSDLVDFLRQLRSNDVIPNVTVNQNHFIKPKYINLLRTLVRDRLIFGIGVSFTHANNYLFSLLQEFPNVVLHVINGYHRFSDIEKLFNRNLKLLILGYKNYGRGADYQQQFLEVVNSKKDSFYKNIHKILRNFEIVSFDNLAIEQLNMRRLLLKHEWDKFYMGPDGSATFYLDLVKQEYALNSFSPMRFPISGSIVDMFQHCRLLQA